MTKPYTSMTMAELAVIRNELNKQYEEFQELELSLNMSRGKPSPEQLDLSRGMMDILGAESDLICADGEDCRNYGVLEGIPEMRQFFADLLGVEAGQVIVGGNSSLNMMFDMMASAMHDGFPGYTPWGKEEEKPQFLCPVPGYDRHFSVTEYFGIEMVLVPMTPEGPHMDIVESMATLHRRIKGIWCIPKYCNPQGITYSDAVVQRLASMKPAAPDFKIFWDNAYCVHELTDTPDTLLNIMEECRKYGHEDRPVQFCSTSKITFAGSGVAAMAGSENTLKNFRRRLSFQTIGPDKVNQLRHLRFLKDMDGVKAHMEKHRQILAPKFAVVMRFLEEELTGTGAASWITPKGGYFVSVDVMEGCAKRVVELCEQAGVTLTHAGATYPYGQDPKDSNIRLAPSFPPVEELEQAMQLFCICVKLAAVERMMDY